MHLNCFINLVFLKSVKIDPLNQFGWFDLLMGNISDWCPIERTQTHTHHYLSLSKNVNHDVNTTIKKLVSGNWSLKHKRWRYQVKVKKNLRRILFVCNVRKKWTLLHICNYFLAENISNRFIAISWLVKCFKRADQHWPFEE